MTDEPHEPNARVHYVGHDADGGIYRVLSGAWESVRLNVAKPCRHPQVGWVHHDPALLTDTDGNPVPINPELHCVRGGRVVHKSDRDAPAAWRPRLN